MLLSFNYTTNIYGITPTQYHTSSTNTLITLPKPFRKIHSPPITNSSSSISASPAVHENHEQLDEPGFNFSTETDTDIFNFDGSFDLADLKRYKSPVVEINQLEDLPEEWRRSRLAWLCKELPSYRSRSFTRVLNAQRKWITQSDCTYVAIHCLRIRQNDAAFKVYKWMGEQNWFQFDFALASKLADYLGKERKCLRCREVFDDIMNRGLIPNESTFHILIVAYLSSSDYIEEACSVYNRMIHLGGYKPRLSLHNSLFRALVSRPPGACKQYLEQAEFIFGNITMCGLKIHDDIYGGLIWLHSYQDVVDKERIASLRAEMRLLGIGERLEVLVSVLRACGKEGDLAETERTWTKILSYTNKPPTQAFVYMMEVYSKIGKPMRSLDTFREMQGMISSSVVAYYKIIKIVCKAQEDALAESLMEEFVSSGMKPLVKSYIDIMDMYSNLSMHSKLEATFFKYLEKCRPNRTVCGIYLDSLVQIGNIDKAEEIFDKMHGDETIGVGTKSCNTLLRGYLNSGHDVKAKQLYFFMSEKKYEVDASLMEKVEHILSLKQEELKKPRAPNLSGEQREILIGLLLGGVRVVLDTEKKNHAIRFLFREDSKIHYFLKMNIYHKFREWLACKLVNEEEEDVPWQFTTISHSYFMFYADQFWPQGQPVTPKLIHRWLTPRVLAYWYMYSGYRTSSGDILLKLNFAKEDVMRITKTLKAKSLDCRMKQRGKAFWIGFLGCDAMKFWELTEPFVHVDLREYLAAGTNSLKGTSGAKGTHFNGGSGGSDSDGNASGYSDDEFSV